MSKRPSKFSCGTISQIRSEFSRLLKECGRKKELPYNFTFDESLKRTEVNQSYYIMINDVRPRNREGCFVEVETNLELCLYYQCGKLEKDTQERALVEGEGFAMYILNDINRPACFQYIRWNRLNLEPVSSDNEYIIKVCLDFDVKQTLRIDTDINNLNP